MGEFDYMQNSTVLEVMERASRKAARQFDHLDAEDLLQEAHIMVATDSNLQSAIEAEEYGLLQFRLQQDLSNYCMKDVRRTGRDVAFAPQSDDLGTSTVVTGHFSDLSESGFRGGSEPIEHDVITRQRAAV